MRVPQQFSRRHAPRSCRPSCVQLLSPYEIESAVDDPMSLFALRDTSTRGVLWPTHLARVIETLMLERRRADPLGIWRLRLYASSHIEETAALSGGTWVTDSSVSAAVQQALIGGSVPIESADVEEAVVTYLKTRDLPRAVIGGTLARTTEQLEHSEAQLATALAAFVKRQTRHDEPDMSGKKLECTRFWKAGADRCIARVIKRLSDSQYKAVHAIVNCRLAVVAATAASDVELVVDAVSATVAAASRRLMLVSPTRESAGAFNARSRGYIVPTIDDYCAGNTSWFHSRMIVLDAHLLTPAQLKALLSATSACCWPSDAPHAHWRPFLPRVA